MDMELEELVLGEGSGIVELDSAQMNRLAALRLAEQAQRFVYIFTPDLDARVYDSDEFIAALSRLARSHRRARVAVVVKDSTPAVAQGHRIIGLAQRLSSYVEIRNPDVNHADLNESFMLVDGVAFMRRKLADRYEAVASFNDPFTARRLGELFDEVWQRATPDPKLRRLHL